MPSVQNIRIRPNSEANIDSIERLLGWGEYTLSLFDDMDKVKLDRVFGYLSSNNHDLANFVHDLSKLNYKFYFNNVKIKSKKNEKGEAEIVEEYPFKPYPGNDGVEKKAFYFKPINSESNRLIHKAIMQYIKVKLGKI